MNVVARRLGRDIDQQSGAGPDAAGAPTRRCPATDNGHRGTTQKADTAMHEDKDEDRTEAAGQLDKLGL